MQFAESGSQKSEGRILRAATRSAYLSACCGPMFVFPEALTGRRILAPDL
jgi:hypothetical protein